MCLKGGSGHCVLGLDRRSFDPGRAVIPAHDFRDFKALAGRFCHPRQVSSAVASLSLISISFINIL